jgi:hypothetical protein
MKPKVVANKVTSKSIFMPSFINQLQYKIMRAVEKEPKNMKFKLVLVPEDYALGDEPVEHENFTECIDDYLTEHKLTEEQLKEDIEMLMSIPPEELKSIIRLYCIPPEYIMKEVIPDELEKT